MSQDIEIPKHYVTTYRDNIALLTQQKRSRLEMTMTSFYGYTGEKASPVHQFGQTEMRELEGRNEDTPIMGTPRDKRWITPRSFDWGTLIDTIDKMQMMIDPTSPLTMAGLAAANRKKDEVIISRFFAAAKVGKDGETNKSWPSGNLVDTDVGGTGTGMNFAKIVGGVEILGGDEDLEDYDDLRIYCGLTKKLNSKLLREIEVGGKEFDKYKFVIDDKGKVRSGLGVTFVHSEKWAKANGVVDLPMWTNAGMHFGMWEGDVKTQVFRRPDKKNMPQVMIDMTGNATRLEESHVVKIQATED